MRRPSGAARRSSSAALAICTSQGRFASTRSKEPLTQSVEPWAATRIEPARLFSRAFSRVASAARREISIPHHPGDPRAAAARSAHRRRSPHPTGGAPPGPRPRLPGAVPGRDGWWDGPEERPRHFLPTKPLPQGSAPPGCKRLGAPGAAPNGKTNLMDKIPPMPTQP